MVLASDPALGVSDVPGSVGSPWYVVTSITGSVTCPTNSNCGFTTGAISGLDPASGLDIVSGSGEFIIDNKVTLVAPFTDNDSGIGFYVGGTWVNGKNIGGTEMNIWNNAGTNNLLWYEISPTTQQYVYTQINGADYSGTANDSTTPEPASLMMFITGLAGFGGTVVRRFIA
jgi:hypothetical protein